MIFHLSYKVCLKLTAPKKDDFKRIGYQKPWYITKHISTYFKYLNYLQDRLNNRVITTTESEKIMAAMARMHQRGYFTQGKLTDWEINAEVDKTWVNFKTYFSDLYQSQEQFTKATAKKSMYHEETNHVGSSSNARTVGSTINTGNEKAMMMADLQFTHAEKLNRIQEANDKAMAMATQAMQNMAEWMKVIQDTSARQVSSMASIPGTLFKQQTALAAAETNSKGERTAVNNETVLRNGEMTWKARHRCKHCGLDEFHFEANSHKILQNLAKKEAFHKSMQEKWGDKKWQGAGTPTEIEILMKTQH